MQLSWWASLVFSGVLALFRYRVPAIPPRIASSGVGAGIALFGLALWPVQSSPLFVSLVVNGALASALLDFALTRRTELAPVSDGAGDTKLAHRRKMVADGRRLVAEFNLQSDYQHLMDFLQVHEEWQAIRARLDPKVRGDIENGRLLVATGSSSLKDGKVQYLTSEIDRLEGEWGLA